MKSVLKSSFYIFLFSLFCHVGWAQQTCPLRTAFSSVAEMNCEIEKVQNHCDEWFKKNPDTASFARKCHETQDQQIDWRKINSACGEAVYKAWIQFWLDAGKGMKASADFYEACEKDPTLACKKQLAKESFFIYRNDDELRRVDTLDLLRKRDRVGDLASTNPAYRQQMIKAGVPLPEDSTTPMEAIIAAAQAKVGEFGVKTKCYNAEGYVHMACYVLAAWTGGEAELRGLQTAGSWAAKVLEGSKVLEAVPKSPLLEARVIASDDAGLSQALTSSAAGLGDHDGELVHAVALDPAGTQNLKNKILTSKNLTDVEKKNLVHDIDTASAKVAEITKAYPDLPNMPPAERAKIVSLISRLEDQGISRKDIHADIKKDGALCGL